MKYLSRQNNKYTISVSNRGKIIDLTEKELIELRNELNYIIKRREKTIDKNNSL